MKEFITLASANRMKIHLFGSLDLSAQYDSQYKIHHLSFPMDLSMV